MKKLLVLLFFLPLLAFAKGPEIKFERTTHDFGNVKEKGGRVTTTFTFTNTGDQPLVILSCKVACGCTKPSFPDAPVQPGEKGQITITYNPDGRPGEFDKKITVKSNAKGQSTVTLKIKGCVIPSGK